MTGWWIVTVIVALATFAIGLIYGRCVLSNALAEEREISDTLREGVLALRVEKQLALRRIREHAAQLSLDVKKIAPWLGIALALGLTLASCNGDYVYAAQSGVQRMHDAQARFLALDASFTPAQAAEYSARQADYEIAVAELLGDAAYGQAQLVTTISGVTSHRNVQIAAIAQYRRHGAVVLNDLKATPGAVDAALTKAKLCDPKFRTGTVRDVTESQKKRICLEYGISEGCPGKGYEIDHLVSIELGGSNEDANLWPQPVDDAGAGVIGFHTKDVVENRAHKAVCDGRITLAQAQEGIRTDWYAFGLRYRLLE